MSQPTKQDDVAAGSSEVIDLLPEEETSDEAGSSTSAPANTREPTSAPNLQFEPGTRWQFLKQGYDWTGGSLLTKGYRTHFDAVREIIALPAAPLPTFDGDRLASSIDRLDWRHPDHLGVVAEFVSSLNETAPAADSAAASPVLKPIRPRRHPFWHSLSVAIAAGGLLALVSFSLGHRQNQGEVAGQERPQPVPVVAAASPAPVKGNSLPSVEPVSPPLLEVAEVVAPAPAETALSPGLAPAVVVSPDSASTPPPPLQRTRIELETREILVSGRAVAAVVILKRIGSTRGTVRARWKTIPGSATAGVDYESVSAIVKFADGQALRTLFVPILQPPERTEPRSFTIELSRLNKGPALGEVKSTLVTIWGDT